MTVSGTGVVSGASFMSFLARGAIASIFGSLLSGGTVSAETVPLPTMLGGTRVLVNGIAAPLFFVSPAQINFQIPFETPVQRNVSIVVERGGRRTLAATVAVVDYAPEIFIYQRTPIDADPIIVHLDGSLVTPGKPAVANEVLIAYATGVGGLDNAPATGAPAPASPLATSRLTPSITVGRAPAQPLFTA